MSLPLDHRSRPPEEPTDGPAPAVFLLHGRGADMDDLLGLADSLPPELHVLSLQAPDPMGPGYTWYELDLSAGGLHESQPDGSDFRRSLDLLADARAAAVEAYDIDPERLGLLGFSQGGILSLAAVVESPADWAWAAALHSYLPETHVPDPDRSDLAAFPAFLAAGESDDVIPASRGETAASALREAGMDVTYRTYRTGHGIGPDELADLSAWVSDRVE